MAANLLTDEQLMRGAQLTPEYRPLVDFRAGFSGRQGGGGWRYGFADATRRADNATLFQEMVWQPHPNGQLADGTWQPSPVSHSSKP